MSRPDKRRTDELGPDGLGAFAVRPLDPAVDAELVHGWVTHPKAAFWLVKFLEDVGYEGPRHFDAHAYRTEDYAGVREFARGCMRSYLILREKAARWNADPEIMALLAEMQVPAPAGSVARYSPAGRELLLGESFDRGALASRGLAYERLDQLTIDLLLGVR